MTEAGSSSFLVVGLSQDGGASRSEELVMNMCTCSHRCSDCKGKGERGGRKGKTSCRTCGGTGEVKWITKKDFNCPVHGKKKRDT